MLDDGPATGMVLSRAKTKVLVGLKDTPEQALHLKDILTDPTGKYRLHHDNVLLHPHNDAASQMSQYGLVVLGAPVGSAEYKHVFMQDLLSRLTEEHRILQKIVDPQCKFLLLNHCFSKKLNYALRIISPSIVSLILFLQISCSWMLMPTICPLCCLLSNSLVFALLMVD